MQKKIAWTNSAGLPGHGLTTVALLHLHGPQFVPDGEPAEQRVQREAHREGPPRRRPGHRAGPLAQRRQGRRRGPPWQVGGVASVVVRSCCFLLATDDDDDDDGGAGHGRRRWS